MGVRTRSFAVAVAALALAGASPAHAQWGSLLNSVLQQTQQIQQQQEAKRRAEDARLGPRKKWGSPKAVPADLQAAARRFAADIEPAELRPLFERLYIEGERNATLNLERIGLAALAEGQLARAEKAFDLAAFRIDMIYADNPEAQKAKSLWSAEKVKDFKGEPYERAMAYFYRGLVYAARGDFQNARAMFKQADYQDTVAESEQFAGDFALMPFMAGWASYCDGDRSLAADFLKQARNAAKSGEYANASVEQPVLVLFETGRTPFKYGTGKYEELLKWQPHPLPAQRVEAASIGDGSSSISGFIVGGDIAFQATTRGGRPVDAIMNGKAQFKEGAQTVSQVGTAVGAVGLSVADMTGSRDAAGLGLLGAGIGLIAQGVSSATQTQADIREWEQLPQAIWLGGAPTLQTAATGTVTAVSDQGNESYALHRLVDTPRCQLYWGRSISPLSVLSFAGPVEPGQHPRDPVFRQEMIEQFAVK